MLRENFDTGVPYPKVWTSLFKTNTIIACTKNKNRFSQDYQLHSISLVKHHGGGGGQPLPK